MAKKHAHTDTIETTDPITGLIATIHPDEYNQIKIIETIRPKNKHYRGSVRIQQDFSTCISTTDQHAGHATDINYLVQRYKPDELAMYLAAKSQQKQKIEGYDFSKEPNLQEAKNEVYRLEQLFEKLPKNIKSEFPSVVDFMKFLDSKVNVDKLIDLKIFKKEELTPAPNPSPGPTPTPTP